jgi:hypothetical protein
MSLEDLGNIGEFVAAVAVVVSLIYLAVQIRQNTRSVRMASHHSISTTMHELSKTMVYEPAVADLWRRGSHDLDSLSNDERMRFETIAAWLFRMYEELFPYHKRGQIEANFWKTRSRNMLAYLTLPGVRQWWETTQLTFPVTGGEQFGDEFRSYVLEKLKRK